MSGNEQLERMKTSANLEIARAEELISGLRENGQTGLQDAVQLLIKASESYRSGNYYIAWKYAKAAVIATENTENDKSSENKQQIIQNISDVSSTDNALEAENEYVEQYWEEKSENQEPTKKKDTYKNNETEIQKTDFIDDESESSKSQYHVSSEANYLRKATKETFEDYPAPSGAVSDYSDDERIHCKNCKSRITPVLKLFGGYKCPVCGSDVEK